MIVHASDRSSTNACQLFHAAVLRCSPASVLEWSRRFLAAAAAAQVLTPAASLWSRHAGRAATGTRTERLPCSNEPRAQLRSASAFAAAAPTARSGAYYGPSGWLEMYA